MSLRARGVDAKLLSVLRDFPVGLLGVTINYNNLTGETGFGLQIQPMGGRRSGIGGMGGQERNGGLFGS